MWQPQLPPTTPSQMHPASEMQKLKMLSLPMRQQIKRTINTREWVPLQQHTRSLSFLAQNSACSSALKLQLCQNTKLQPQASMHIFPQCICMCAKEAAYIHNLYRLLKRGLSKFEVLMQRERRYAHTHMLCRWIQLYNYPPFQASLLKSMTTLPRSYPALPQETTTLEFANLEVLAPHSISKLQSRVSYFGENLPCRMR